MSQDLKSKLKNVTNGKKYISRLLSKYENNDKVLDEDIYSLLQYHPTKHINVEKLDYLIMKIRKPFNNLALFYKYKESDKLDDISYIICIQNLFGKYNKDKHYEEDVKTGFRNESHIGSKKQFFIDNTEIENDKFEGICDNCKITTTNITTDHYKIPYKQILDNFVNENNISFFDIEIFENEYNEIRLKDNELANKWLNYHDSNAKYRLLCKSCNSLFGAYDYK